MNSIVDRHPSIVASLEYKVVAPGVTIVILDNGVVLFYQRLSTDIISSSATY